MNYGANRCLGYAVVLSTSIFSIFYLAGYYRLAKTKKNGQLRTQVSQETEDNLNKCLSTGVMDNTPHTILSNTSSDNKQKKVLLVAYKRSGSTFTAEILKQSGGVFLSFEPFWAVIKESYLQPKSVCSRNGVCRTPGKGIQSLQTVIQAMQNLFNCQLSKLPAAVLLSFWYFHQGSGNQMLRKCHNLKPNHNKYTKNKIFQKPKCIFKLEEYCKSSSTVIIKTIRLTLEMVSMFTELMPEVEVVHLLRDPRAILHSWESIKDISYDNVRPYARALCKRIDIDLDVTTHSDTSDQKSSIYSLKYECLAFEPKYVVNNLFKYLGFQYTERVKNWLQRFTNGSENITKDIYSVKKGNSAMISSKWASAYPIHALQVINEECQYVIRRLGLDKSIKFNLTQSQVADLYFSVCNHDHIRNKHI